MVLLAECLKLTLTFFFLLKESNFVVEDAVSLLKKELIDKPTELMKMSLPSFAYALQNNLEVRMRCYAARILAISQNLVRRIVQFGSSRLPGVLLSHCITSHNLTTIIQSGHLPTQSSHNCALYDGLPRTYFLSTPLGCHSTTVWWSGARSGLIGRIP